MTIVRARVWKEGLSRYRHLSQRGKPRLARLEGCESLLLRAMMKAARPEQVVSRIPIETVRND